MKHHMQSSVYGISVHALACAMLTALCVIVGAGVATAEVDAKINLNRANAEALQYIPGIGPARAADIIALRKETGGFRALEDLLAVPGIGEKTLLKIQQYGSLNSGVAELTEEMAANPPPMLDAHAESPDASG